MPPLERGNPSKEFLLIMNKMERTYTPAEIANALAQLERMKANHRQSQHRYYERNAEAKKAYAAAHYRRKRAAAAAAAGEAATEPPAV